MPRDRALVEARRLKACLERYGVKVSIELQPGVAGTGWWGGSRWIGNMSHHTVSRRSQGNTPCLALVKRGRVDVPGPLCNGYGGFDEVARIITMGWANHPGAGGPLTVAGHRVPRNNGRPYFFGWEFEGGLDRKDFTPSYREFMARCAAGTLDYLNRPVAAHLEHSTWAPGRKIDRLGYTAASGQREIITLAHNMEDDVNLTDRLGVNPVTKKPETVGNKIDIASNYAFYTWEIARRLEAQVASLQATQANLVSALANVSSGEDFDEERLLTSIRAENDRVVSEIKAETERILQDAVVQVDVNVAGRPADTKEVTP